jgi:hypothetical protein
MLSRFDLPFIVSIVLETIYKKNNIYHTVNLVTIGVCFECCSIGSPAEQIVTEVAGFAECLLSAKVYIELLRSTCPANQFC